MKEKTLLQKINWVEEDAGFLDEGEGKYTLFSIREENGVFFLYIEGENWKKRRKPVKVASIESGRRISEAIAQYCFGSLATQ